MESEKSPCRSINYIEDQSEKKKTMSPASVFSVDTMVKVKVSFQGHGTGWNRTKRRLKEKTEVASYKVDVIRYCKVPC